VQHVKNTQYSYSLKKYIKCNIWRVAVRPSYIKDARFLKANLFNILKVVPCSDYVRKILLETDG